MQKEVNVDETKIAEQDLGTNYTQKKKKYHNRYTEKLKNVFDECVYKTNFLRAISNF